MNKENNTSVLQKNGQSDNEISDNKKAITIKDFHIRIFVYGLIFLVFSIFTFYVPLMNRINISRAEQCFAAKDYLCAFKYYRKAFANNIDNERYVENYFETLSKMKKIAIVQAEMLNLIEDYPNSTIVPKIENAFENIQKDVEKKYEANYIDHVVQGTNVVHWNNIASKVKVYIDNSMSAQLPGFYFDEIKVAFDDYSRALNNALQFYYVNNPKEADIEIIFMDEISGGKCVGTTDCVKILGLTENEISGSVLQKTKIKLRTKDTDSSQFTANQIHNIAKHEIGHALGVSGHSYFSEDVMYPVNNDAEWAEDTQTLLIKRKPFSKRDLNTFRLLYKIVPDITNKRYNIVAHSDMYFPIAVLGTKKQIGEKKLEESNTYLNTVSANFVSQMNLAEGYFVNREFAKAKDAFSEALSFAKTDEEKFTAYHNLAVISYEESDYKMAISYAETANSYTADNKSDEIKAYCYIEMGKHGRAQRILENLLEKYPDNATYSAALVGSYLKQMKFFKMLDEMKRIKEINPDAFLDPAYQPYKFFTNFA